MEIDKIKQFIKLAKEEGVTELAYEVKDLKLKVSFAVTGAPQVHYQPQMQANVLADAKASVAAKIRSDLHEIKSPFVGTFYSSAAPGEPNFVKVGDKIAPGKVLCILEAMKIMNEIEADVSGVIEEMCIENENFVEYGQVLFRIKKA